MPRYMVQSSYTPEAVAAFTKNPEDRTKNAARLLEQIGGRLESYYYCFGDYDAVVIYEAPDDIAAATFALTVVSPGHLRAFKTTKLLTNEEMMEAMRRSGSVSFPRPGSAAGS